MATSAGSIFDASWPFSRGDDIIESREDVKASVPGFWVRGVVMWEGI